MKNFFGLKIVGHMLTFDKFKHLAKDNKNKNRPTIINRAFVKKGTIIFSPCSRKFVQEQTKIKSKLKQRGKSFISTLYNKAMATVQHDRLC
jgi:hypothetical protein